MVDTKPISDQSIIDILETEYGIKGAMLEHLSLGADLNAFKYKAKTKDQSSYFLKLKQGSSHDISIDILQFLSHAGLEQVIPTIQTIHNESICVIDGFTLIVYPFIEGKDGFNCELSQEQWFLLGKALNRVHEMKLPIMLSNRIPKETYSSKWRDEVLSLFQYVETQPVAEDKVASNLLAFIIENIATIYRLVNRAEQLGQKLQKQTSHLVLCHTDIHAGNVFIDKKNDLYILDWDAPIMAPKERDLMFIGGGVANVWNKQHEEQLFYKGYGETKIDKEQLAYYRHERIVEDIAIYCQAILLTATSSQNKETMYQDFIDMFQPQGVIDMAFKVDKELNDG